MRHCNRLGFDSILVSGKKKKIVSGLLVYWSNFVFALSLKFLVSDSGLPMKFETASSSGYVRWAALAVKMRELGFFRLLINFVVI